VLVDQLGDAQQHLGALCWFLIRPRSFVKGFASGFNRTVDVLGVTFSDQSKGFCRRWINSSERFPRSSFDLFATDQHFFTARRDEVSDGFRQSLRYLAHICTSSATK
jgi:hypothetical protein